MTATAYDTQRAAHMLAQAWRGGPPAPWRDIEPPDRDCAFAVQRATLRHLAGEDTAAPGAPHTDTGDTGDTAGTLGGWKVGARGPQAEPACAPLPRSGLMPSGARLTGPRWAMRGVELELAIRLGRDLPPHPTAAQMQQAVDSVLPVIEIVETRLADWKDSSPLAQMADLQSHGALVLGEPQRVAPASLDLRTVEAYLAFDGQPVASTRGGNPAQDLWRLLEWLATHAASQGMPLRAGDVITTGSCTGMLFAPQGAAVLGDLVGLGQVLVAL